MIPSNLPDVFINQVKNLKDKTVFEYRLRRNVPYTQISWDSFYRMVTEIVHGLKDLGIKKGDHIAILSGTRYEWAVCDIGILSLGAIVVPLYPTLPENAVNYIINNAGCRIVILEDKGQLQKIRSQWSSLPTIEYAIVISDLGDLPVNDHRIITYKDLKDRGKLNLSKSAGLLEHQVSTIKKDDVATIIYTSGTTGNPKGVVITHNNILSVLKSISTALKLKKDDKFLSFLPLSHVFERVGGYHFALYNGSPISYCSGMDQIASSLKYSGSTVMLVVPRLLEKTYSKISSNLKSLTGVKSKLVNWAFSIGKQYFSCREKKNKMAEMFFGFQYLLADKLIFSKIRKDFAPTLKYFISGGAPLSREIAEFFCIIGIKVLEGYGLTETSAPASVNRLDNFRLGTVGIPLDNVNLKIAEDGEILISGPTVFKEYYKNELATKEAFKDGWFCTGDIGVIDSEGFLKITDRKKDLIINSAGKNIAPQNIENSIKTSHYISNVIVIGDKRKYLSALITLDQIMILKYANENKIIYSDNDYADLISKKEIFDFIDEEIKVRTSDFADYEQIRRFIILPEDFKIETGELTPTLKVKRKFVESKYKDYIDSMYPPE